ncbi:MAG: hypothetical protein KF878_05360 [Planctomycetes bacterium]|nr:hypothetical protein [Planctomycetota bacterium]
MSRTRPVRAATLLALLLALPALGQPEPTSSLSSGVPPIVETLGADRFVRLTGVNEPGKVVWFNWQLAEALGLEVPRGHRMTPEFERELVRHLSFRLLKPGEAATGRPTVEMFADRYGGWGMGYNQGAGRAAFFGRFNLNVKGVGVTPLVSNNTHYSHRHGGAPLKEGILEAVWGEVGTNLFRSGSTRILAVIDTGDATVWEDGGRERRALIIRAGHQLRPAHLLAEGFSRSQNFEALINMLEATGTLVRRVEGGRAVVDLPESLRRVADRHAGTAAELYRHRILHGGLSPGNKSFDGGMLDLGTVTSQPRTAPVHVLDYTDGTGRVRADLRFESENEWRVRDLQSYSSVAEEARGKPGFKWATFDIAAYYRESYQRQLELKLLEAAGLKRAAAERLRAAEPTLVRGFADKVHELGALTNDVEMNIERNDVRRGSVADVFNALREVAGAGARGTLTGERVFEALKVDADRPADREAARRGADALADLHKRVMSAAWTNGSDLYDDRRSFERSVETRAGLENVSLDALARKALNERLTTLIADYERTGDPTALRGEMERLVDTGVRDVEALMAGERLARLADGSVLSGARTAEGLNYAVRSAADGGRFVRVELPLTPVEGGFRLTSLDGSVVSESQARSTLYRFTTDAWASHQDVSGTLGTGRDGRPALIFEAPVRSGQLGAIEGAFWVREGDRWLNQEGRNYRGYRFAAPDRADLTRLERRITHPEGEGFAPRGRGVAGELRIPSITDAELNRIFEAARAGTLARGAERVEAASEGERAALRSALARVTETTLSLEATNEVDARLLAERNMVRITTGLIAAVEAKAAELPAAERAGFRARALGLIFAHELAHAAGIRSERAADAEAVRALRRAGLTNLTEADLRRTLSAFDGERAPATLLERIRDFARYGTTEGRAAALAREARGEADPFARHRRVDGTIDWRRASGDRALREANGLVHFAMALFLKELAVVVKTGDRLRIEEFFDGLLTTDFYTHYGLFVVGARAGEIAYVKYLQKFVKPQFVNGVLKTNVVLATGIALPMIVGGHFEGKAFAISVGALGLSSTAVKAGVASIRWVTDLRKPGAAASVARTSAAAARLAKVGGWFYTAAETAVVLYLAEEIETRVRAAMDLAAARREVADAARDLLRVTGDPASTPEQVREAVARHHEAWGEYRNFLYGPLHQDEVLYASRLEKAARRAKILADERAAALARLASQPALRRNIEARHGSLEAYADARAREDEATITREVEEYTAAYLRDRDANLRAVYEGNRRGGDLLAGLEHADWLARGARPGAAGDPWGGRTDPFARLGRGRAEGALDDRLRNASRNRLETYDDERAVLELAARALAGERRGAVDDALALVALTRTHDERLYRGDGGALDLGAPAAAAPAPTPGLSGALERATDR